MKISTLIIVLFLAIDLSGQTSQDTLDKQLSIHICKCVEDAKQFSDEQFSKCFQKTLEANTELVNKILATVKGDTSEQAGYEFGQALYNRISVKLIYDCDPFYHLMDTIRYADTKLLNKDSVKARIDSLNKFDKKIWDKDFYTERGVMYFQISSLDNALADFNSALKIDQLALQSIYFKAWTLEIKGKYDEAFELYSQLAKLTSKNDFNILAAVVRRKKNSL